MRVVQSCPEGVVFRNLRVLRLDVENIRSPFLSSSVTDLTLSITRSSYTELRKSVSIAFQSLSRSLPNLRHLRIDGDQRLQEFQGDLTRLVMSLTNLRTLTLAPSAVCMAMYNVASTLPSLSRVDVAECGRGIGSRATSEPASAVSISVKQWAPNAFRDVNAIAVTASTTQAFSGFIIHRNFPIEWLAEMWVRFPNGPSCRPDDIKELLRMLAYNCTSLLRLVLRFAPVKPSSADTFQAVLPLQLHHIAPFLEFHSLREFTFDHAQGLAVSSSDIAEIALHASRFEKLWLNPYPINPLPPSFSISCLADFAKHCHAMKSLALYMDGFDSSCLNRELARFSQLEELFVGWSSIPVRRSGQLVVGQWALMATFLSIVLPAWTSISCVGHYMDSEDPFMAISSGIRLCSLLTGFARCQAHSYANAWDTVAGMAQFLRFRRVRGD